MATLKPYRVTIGRRETILRLSEETAARAYPDAVELKIGPEPVTPETPKATPRTRKTAAK
ncbi:hypothetical protein [Corynebacterium bouchesdurhonense]|uniref:hypothetical protein n=1 Tax=Corynebacterium bouchesdurhonense TaxID=1720192 RepID=UPI0008349E71|nr:hypothetical protein [Corynebacterium bouchesdurhonense]